MELPILYPNVTEKEVYRVGQVVEDLGWVDIDFGHSAPCPVLLGQLEVWQNGLWSWAG